MMASSGVAQSLSRRIRGDIEQRIMAGDWPPGYRLPAEHELMSQYDCARMTVSKAMSGLVDAGLIERRRRAGSFVSQPRVQSVILDIPDIAADVAKRGKRYNLRLVSQQVRKANPASHDECQLAEGGKLMDIVCIHCADDRPFALEERLISVAAVPQVTEVDFSCKSPGVWLLGHVPWTQAEHRISARSADRAVADHLDIPLDYACLVLERRTWRGGQHITRVKQTFPGDAYDLVARFAPNS